LEECLALWYSHAEEAKLSTSDDILRKVAQDIGTALEISPEDLKFSDGWLQRFKKRFGIRSVVMHREAASAPLISMNEERETLKGLLSNYQPEDIFNADETGLFFRMPPNRTLATSKNVAGYKKDKTRITVLLGCNSTGSEKLKPLVIGTSKNPRSLNKVNRALLPVEYHANKKAWMRSDIFIPWLEALNKKFASGRRQVLLLVDNAPSHFQNGEIPLFSNMTVHCLPPNCTAHLQPMDAGIINDFKVIYKRLYLEDIIKRFEELQPSDASSLHKIEIRKAIDFISSAWSEVRTTTIANCWKHTGILPNQPPTPMVQENLNNIQPLLEQAASIYPDVMNAQEYLEIEDNLQTDEPKIPTIADIINHLQEPEFTNISDDDDDVEQETIRIGMDMGMEYGKNFLTFLEQQDEVEEEEVISFRKILKHVERLVIDSKKQKKVTDFFS